MARSLAFALVATVCVAIGSLEAPASASGTGSITILVVSLPNAPQDFPFTGCLGSGCATFLLDDDDNDWPEPAPDRVTSTTLAAGTYTVTEGAVANWNLISITCNTGEIIDLAARRVTIDLAAGEDVTCTFTNDTQVVTIVEDARPDDAQDFAFSSCSPLGCGEFVLDDDGISSGSDGEHYNGTQNVGLPVGTYTITQASPPAHWSAPRLQCGGPRGSTSWAPTTRTVTITLSPNADVSCIFINAAASITVIQDSEPDSAVPLSFTGCGSAGCGTFNLDDATATAEPGSRTVTAVPPGTYTVTQAADPGTTLTALACDTGETVDLARRRVTIELAAEEVVTCRFTNAVTP